MVAIGIAMVVVLLLCGCSQKLTSTLTGGTLFFVWLFLGGTWD